MNKDEALDILEKLSLKVPFDIIDWEGPYSINFKACRRELVYNLNFKDIVKSENIILKDFLLMT